MSSSKDALLKPRLFQFLQRVLLQGLGFRVLQRVLLIFILVVCHPCGPRHAPHSSFDMQLCNVHRSLSERGTPEPCLPCRRGSCLSASLVRKSRVPSSS